MGPDDCWRGRIGMLDRGGGAAADGEAPLHIKRGDDIPYLALAVRVAVVLTALAIVYLRTPSTFTNPQFWGEDIELFRGARLDGWSALSTTLAGYLVSAQFLIAILASYVSPVAAPAIYNYAAVLLTLVVVWLITSPRLHMPAKPLLAIAVVIVPMGFEELGTLTNIQWILPIGAFVLLFMDAPRSPAVLFGETFLLGLMSFSGPFSIFLAPFYVWQLMEAREKPQRRRLLLLTTIVALGGLTQLLMIFHHPDTMYQGPAVPYSPTLWITMPFARMLTVFGPMSRLFTGLQGAVVGLLLLAAVIALACRLPFRTQKIFMVLFATAIALGGMYKFRVDLAPQIAATRYFYVGSVFTLWFICCAFSQTYLRFVAVAIVAATELMLLRVVANTPKTTDDLEWPMWAKYASSGLPVIIPTFPIGWFLDLPPTPGGPLVRFASWQGNDINHMAEIDASACSGTIGLVLPVNVVNVGKALPEQTRLWTTTGLIWWTRPNEAASLVALVDQSDKVVAFGLSGFKFRQKAPPGVLASQWIANFISASGLIVRAYGISDDGQRVCRLGPDP